MGVTQTLSTQPKFSELAEHCNSCTIEQASLKVVGSHHRACSGEYTYRTEHLGSFTGDNYRPSFILGNRDLLKAQWLWGFNLTLLPPSFLHREEKAWSRGKASTHTHQENKQALKKQQKIRFVHLLPAARPLTQALNNLVSLSLYILPFSPYFGLPGSHSKSCTKVTKVTAFSGLLGWRPHPGLDLPVQNSQELLQLQNLLWCILGCCHPQQASQRWLKASKVQATAIWRADRTSPTCQPLKDVRICLQPPERMWAIKRNSPPMDAEQFLQLRRITSR